MPNDRMQWPLLALAGVIIAIVLVWCNADSIDGNAAEDTVYCKIGIQPFAFEELNELPYSELQSLNWNREDGFTELTQSPVLLYTLIPTSCENIIQVYAQDKTTYMMQFKEARGADGDPHPIDTAWVQLNTP